MLRFILVIVFLFLGAIFVKSSKKSYLKPQISKDVYTSGKYWVILKEPTSLKELKSFPLKFEKFFVLNSAEKTLSFLKQTSFNNKLHSKLVLD
jgi:hypothetical protein